MLIRRIILPLTIIRIKSIIQIMFQPRIILKSAATIFPSVNLVTKPRISAVIGMIARIILNTLF